MDGLDSVVVDDLEGRYEFIDELGDGASSKVFLASTRHETPTREVAVKVLDLAVLNKADDLMAAVRAEVQVVRTVRHPGIVKFIETCRDGASLCVVTEALTGGDLFQKVKEDGAPLTEAAAREVFAQVAMALEHLHTSGYAHRDVKAENIVAVDDSEDGQHRVKLIDFGSSAPIGHAGLTGLHATAHYCAPEVIASSGGCGTVEPTNAPYDERCDLWSLGVLLYFLLSRRLPFQIPAKAKKTQRGGPPADGAEDEADLLRRVADASYTFAPEKLWASVSADARDLVERLMRKAPGERISWGGIRTHAWCATAIREHEAAIKEQLGDAAPIPVGGAPTMQWEGMGGVSQPREHAAMAASHRLKAILERKKRASAVSACCCGSASEVEERAVAVV